MDSQEPTSLAGALDALWTRFLPEMNQRVATLESAAASVGHNEFSSEVQERAIAAAHKLAGVLGTFGLTRGTALARELELMYSRQHDPDPSLIPHLCEITKELRAIVAGRN